MNSSSYLSAPSSDSRSAANFTCSSRANSLSSELKMDAYSAQPLMYSMVFLVMSVLNTLTFSLRVSVPLFKASCKDISKSMS